MQFAFDTFAHTLWGAKLPVLVLTDNRSLTQYFQAKTTPSPLWTAVDQVLNFSFIIGHIPGTANAAANFLSRVNVDLHTKRSLKISTRMPVKHDETEFPAESSNPDLPALIASTTSGLASLQCYQDEDDCLDVELEFQELPQSIIQRLISGKPSRFL